ncbi:MAG: glycoside hydrolase family 3 N-terminal domain-containing protein [Velocimicrobium sp.]
MKGFKQISVLLAISLLFQTPSIIVASTGNIDSGIVAESAQTAKQIEAEGIVLLKNVDQALPLTANKKVNVFGCGTIDPYYGSIGSGAIKSDQIRSFYDSLTMVGMEYNQTLYDNYSKWYQNHKNDNFKFSFRHERVEMPSDLIDFGQAQSYSDTAIVMLSRSGSEIVDLNLSSLKLQDNEAVLIDAVATHFDTVIILFNTVNMMEMGFLEQYPSIKAAAIIWTPGEIGMESVAKLLTGEVNPSGKLADTIAYHVADHPSTENFGDYQYTKNLLEPGQNFVEYEEGIYVGYRYFETFHKDVQYPFGYGLSYTNFEWDNILFHVNGDTISADVTVTNTGNLAGKDVIQVYVSLPYIKGGIEKSAIQLAAYVKTDLLSPGASKTYTADFKITDIASYDEKTEQAWILDPGIYKIQVARNVKEIVASFNYTINEKRIVKNDSKTGTTIKNLFQDASYDTMTYLSRAAGESTEGNSTYPTSPVNFTAPVDLSGIDSIVPPIADPSLIPPTIGAEYEKTITLQDVYQAPSLEEAFLDQLTLNEMIELICDCGYKTSGIDRLLIPATQDNDGPASVKGSGGVLYSNSGLAWPAATCLACTWNKGLAWEMGDRCGIEANYLKTNVWYAPAANIHRNPMEGRNYEYYSEDPLLTGQMAAAVTKGAQSHHIMVTVKHFALNEQEKNREGLLTWANEQSMREIYLKPFEIAVKEGNAKGIMSAYNRLGKTWAGGSRALLTDLLRDEWGYDGFVITDFYQYEWRLTQYMNPVQAIYAQNDALLTGLYFTHKGDIEKSIKNQYKADKVGFGTAIRKCCKNLIHMKMQTLAFNNQGTNSPDTIRIEGEIAAVSGSAIKGDTFIEKASDVSRGFVLCNLSKVGNKATWTLEASEAGMYDLTMALASTHLLGFDVELKKQVSLYVNGAGVDLAGISVPGEGILKYNVFHTYGPCKVELCKGTNIVEMTVIGTSVPNVDYLEFTNSNNVE